MADPAPLSFKTEGGGGLGGVAYKDRARPPPRGLHSLPPPPKKVVTVPPPTEEGTVTK